VYVLDGTRDEIECEVDDWTVRGTEKQHCLSSRQRVSIDSASDRSMKSHSHSSDVIVNVIVIIITINTIFIGIFAIISLIRRPH